MEDKLPNQTSTQAQSLTGGAFQPSQVDPAPNVVQQADPVSQPIDHPSNKKAGLVWIIVGLIILLVILGGTYFYLTQSPEQGTPTSTPKPLTQQESMENELNSLGVESEGNDFSDVDKDLQSL